LPVRGPAAPRRSYRAARRDAARAGAPRVISIDSTAPPPRLDPTRRRPPPGRGSVLSHPRPTLCRCRVTTTAAALAGTRSRSAVPCGRPRQPPPARRGTPTPSSSCPQLPLRGGAARSRPRHRPAAAVSVGRAAAADPIQHHQFRAPGDRRGRSPARTSHRGWPNTGGHCPRAAQLLVARLVTSRVVPHVIVDDSAERRPHASRSRRAGGYGPFLRWPAISRDEIMRRDFQRGRRVHRVQPDGATERPRDLYVYRY
jgi:hypothetical protein